MFEHPINTIQFSLFIFAGLTAVLRQNIPKEQEQIADI